MENLMFSLNATVPIFLTMVIGIFMRKSGIFTDEVTERLNKFVFTAGIPALLFQDISGADVRQVWDTGFVVFCFLVTLISILAVSAGSFFLKDRSIQGEVVQASYRSSAAILGIAFIQNIYGNSGMAPLMIIGTVPLYNVMAVIVLSLLKPGQKKMDRELMKKTLKGIVTNPIILGIAFGLLWSCLHIPQPVILQKTIKNVAVLATPLGLMSMGASFDLKKACGRIRPALVCSFIKLVGFAAVFLPAAVAFGYREERLVAILVMLGSATTVSSYIMAKNMGHEGTVTSSTVMLSTCLSAFTLTGWLYLLKCLGLI
ncbi:MAG: AEC family transporter [Oscillospiraceae bacterium]|nr:AEC family transporter [Oscillospiraceae bacterium]